MARITIDIESKLSQSLQNCIADINSSQTMLAVHNTLAKMCDPYVPYLSGTMAERTIEISSEGVTYTTPYARRQYYGDNFKHTVEKHPLATSRWDKAMMRDHGDEFAKEVELIMRERMIKFGKLR